MKRSTLLFTLILSMLIVFPHKLLADSAFEKTSGGVSREALKFYAGQVADLAVAKDGTVYAALNSPNGVFCSTDGAESWIAPPEDADFGNIAGLTLGEDSDTVYFIGGIELYKMTDKCASYTKLSNGDEIKDFGFAIAYGSSTLVAAMRNNILARSEDGGETFTQVTISEQATSISSLAAAQTGGVFLALVKRDESNTTYLYKSTDSAATWVDTGKSGEFTVVGINPQDETQYVLIGTTVQQYSTDSGASWSDLGSHPIPRGTLDFANNRIYVCGQWTANFGTTWNSIETEASSYDSTPGWYFAGDPNDPNIAYSASERGVAKTTDDGDTWTDKVEGMLGVTIYDIAQSTDKDTVYIAATGGLAKCENFTDEENREWNYPIEITGALGSPRSVIIDPNNPDLVIVGANAAIHYSTTGGNSWTEAISPGLTSPNDFARLADGSYVVAHGQNQSPYTGGVMRSTDNGQTWVDLSVPNTPPANCITQANGKIYIGVGADFDSNTTTRKGIYIYDGTSWSQAVGDLEGFPIEDIQYSGTTVFAAGGATDTAIASGVFRSTDDGATWENLTSNGLQALDWYRTLAIDPASPTTLYVAGGRPAGTCRIYQSTDNGDTWSLYYTGLKDEVPNVMLVDALTAGFNTGAYEFTSSLSSPVYALWNGFLNMTNILELVNPGSSTLTVSVSLFSNDGASGQIQRVTIPAQGQYDLILNTVSPFAANSYGMVKIEFSGGQLDGRLSFYRSASSATGGNDYDFAFSVPFENSAPHRKLWVKTARFREI